MNNQTVYNIHQSITQEQSMIWIFLPLVLCIALLCMQIDGTVAINFKWTPIHTLTQIAIKGANNAQKSATTEPKHQDKVHPTPISQDSEKNDELVARIQSLERALDAARQDNMSLEAQRQSLQRICHVLVQQDDAIDQDTHDKINETSETEQTPNCQDFVPLDTANDVASTVSREPDHIPLRETVEMTPQLPLDDDPLESTDVELSDNVEFPSYSVPPDTTTKNEQTETSFSTPETPTADRLRYHDEDDVDWNVDSVLVQIEQCLLVAVTEPRNWMGHVTELNILQRMLEDIPLADSMDLVADHLLLLAEHVRTLIVSPVESIVGVAWSFIKFVLRMFGDHLVLFLDVVLSSLTHEVHILLHLYEATQADQIKLLILKKIARILSSSTMDELTVPWTHLENFMTRAVESSETEEALATARQVLCAFYEMRDMATNCASDYRSDAGQDGQPVLLVLSTQPTASPRYYMRRMRPPRATDKSPNINAVCQQKYWTQAEVAELQNHSQDDDTR